MKKMLITAICVFVGINLIADEANVQGNKKTDTRKIHLEVESDVVVFGNDVTLKVSYQNHGATAWELNEREPLVDTLIQFALSDTQDPPNKISWLEIAHTRHVEQGIRSIFRLPPPTPLTIAAGDKPDFTIVLTSAMIFRHFAPGEHYTLWITDTRENLESNKVEIHFKLTMETMDFALGNSERVIPYNAKLLYLRWVEKFTPVEEKENFKLPQDGYRQGLYDEIKTIQESYRNYFETPDNAHVIQAAIKQANTQIEAKRERERQGREQAKQELMQEVGLDGRQTRIHPDWIERLANNTNLETRATQILETRRERERLERETREQQSR